MEQIGITVEPRAERGTREVRRLREQGWIPAVVYSEGQEALPCRISAHEYLIRISARGSSQLYRFESSDPTLNGRLTVIKDFQHEPLKERVLHLDFLALRVDRPITVSVALDITGESPAVKNGVGVVNQVEYEIDIESLPDQIPSSIPLDISSLDLGDSLRAADLALPQGVSLAVDGDTTLVSVVAKQSEVEPAKAEAAAEGASEGGAAGEEPKKSE